MAVFSGFRKRRQAARESLRQKKDAGTQETTTSYKFSPSQASKNVTRIKRHVEKMIGDSLVVRNISEKNSKFALFHRDEVRIGRHLGAGGFSDVYEVEGFTMHPSKSRRYNKRQTISRQFYADTAKRENGECRYIIKELRPVLADDPTSFQMAASDLAVEAQYLSSLDHPHILKIHGWSSDWIDSLRDGSHNGFFLILDRLEGDMKGKIEEWKKVATNKSRNAMMNNKPFLGERVKAAYQIACALEYLHDRGMIFRDLKPDNVGVDVDGNVKLFDFGLAREIPEGDADDIFLMSGKIGTRRYMAPEVVLCEKYNLKADVYSWACNFYELLALEKPYKNFSQAMHKDLCCLRGNRPDIESKDWPDSIKLLLEMSWGNNIESRPTIKEVVTALKAILLELDSTNTDVLTIRERRKRSVILELPEDFASSAFKNMAPAVKNLGETSTMTTSPESLG